MSSEKHHFDYEALGGPLVWILSRSHEYKLSPDTEPLKLKATARGTVLGGASTIDRFIWDEIVQKKRAKWCDSLTLWTTDVEFNLLLFGTGKYQQYLRCAYFNPPSEALCLEHLKYWDLTIPSTKRASITSDQLRGAIDRASGGDGAGSNRGDAAALKALLPQIVVWNRYTRGAQTGTDCYFTRRHAFALDPFRANLQTIPIPTGFLQDGRALKRKKLPASAAKWLYELLLDRYAAVVGRGSPTRRNLEALASLLADPNIKVALVTGEPGTGKENLCKAIYFGNKLRRPAQTHAEAVFAQTTAVEIQSALDGSTTPQSFLRAKIRETLTSKTTRPDSPFVFIDELNKAEQKFLGAMLRPLEQGKEELETKGDPKYILAASQHIDELAKKPPQDFWTRVSHQLRVVHPLSRVSEADGDAFLSSFFYSNWWSFVRGMVHDYPDKQHAENLIKAFLGKVNNEILEPSPLCNQVRDEFVYTLVPLVSRDTLSLRGARSILSQAFARLSWFARFQDPSALNDPSGKEVAIRVNTAIQDVMAILNPARATPAGMEDSRPKK